MNKETRKFKKVIKKRRKRGKRLVRRGKEELLKLEEHEAQKKRSKKFWDKQRKLVEDVPKTKE